MGANMQKMMKQMQKMQAQMAQLQEELATRPVTGSAGGGVVKVTVNGANQLISVEIDDELMAPDEKDMLQDLIVAASNDALRQAQEMTEREMGALTKNLKMPNMPGLF